MLFQGNVTRLRYFKAVCECGTITKASEVLNISQPSLTAAMRELERELGITLFNRSKNAISLSLQGRYVYEKTVNILQQFDSYYKSVLEYGEKAEKIVTIGVPPVLGTMMIPKIIQKAKFIYQDSIDIHIQECATMEALEGLDSLDLDLAIFLHNDIPDRYNYKVVSTCEMCYMVSECHPLAKKRSVSEKDIVEYPYISLPKGSFHYEIIKNRFEDVGVKASVRLFSRQLSTILRVLETNAENGGTILFDDIRTTNEKIVRIPLNDPIICNYIVAWNKAARLTPTQKKVYNLIVEGIREIKDNKY